jgi:hypothetical protein
MNARCTWIGICFAKIALGDAIIFAFKLRAHEQHEAVIV